MHFEIENIGKVKQAIALELRGITVLAGNNSTGKSTFGKALYCMFSAFYNSDEKIIRTRKKDIETLLARYSRQSFSINNRLNNLVNEIWNKRESSENIRNIVLERITNWFGVVHFFHIQRV